MKNNRLITLGLIIFIIFISFVSCASKEKQVTIQQVENPKIEYSGTEEYTVEPFDTLSAIAVKYIPSDEYMQKWINDVKRLNGRKTNDIYFGETIKVYYY